MNAPHPRGYGLVELVVSIGITVAVVSGAFALMDPAHGLFHAEIERIDIRQRARVSVDAMFRDLVAAGAGGQAPAVAPLRRGLSGADAPGSVFRDRLSIRYVPRDAGAGVTVTYWTGPDAEGVPRLMRYDGDKSDLPVADHVSLMGVEYFDSTSQLIDIERFADGPWVPDAVSAERFDADLLAVRRVRVLLRIRAASLFPQTSAHQHQVQIDVALRNLNLP